LETVRAALQAYARHIADLGLTLTESDAEVLVRAIVRAANVDHDPADERIRAFAQDLIRTARDIAQTASR
jgi:hypothetical protein